jgi:hypothetical protein
MFLADAQKVPNELGTFSTAFASSLTQTYLRTLARAAGAIQRQNFDL